MRKAFLLAAVSFGALSIPSIVLAQSAANPEPAAQGPAKVATDGVQIEEVIVTAQKRAERLLDVPVSITAASGEQMARQMITDPSDLTKVAPGFSFQQSTFSTPIYSIRGIGFYDTSAGASPTVSVYVDQVPLPYSVMTRGASIDLERVEVLKGPQGTLFGQNSTGGALLYIAAKPSATPHASASVDVGNFSTVNGQASISGPITNTLSARIVGRVETRGAWQKSYAPNDAVVGKAAGDELGRRRFYNGRALFDWTPSDKVNFDLALSGWQDKSDTQAAQIVRTQFLAAQTAANAGVYAAFNQFKAVPDDNRLAGWDANCACKRDDSFGQAALRGQVDISDKVTLNSISAFTRYKENSYTDPDGTPFSNLITHRVANIDSYFQELRLSGDTSSVRWMIGANYARDTVDENNLQNINATNGSVGPFQYHKLNITTDQKISTWAGFGSLDYSITDKLAVQGSLRYTDRTNEFAGCLRDGGDGALATAIGTVFRVSTVPGGCVTRNSAGVLLPIVSTDLKEKNTSYRGSINYKPDGDTLIYASISKGYKAGSFSLLPAVLDIQLAPAVEESLLAYEAGFKVSLADRKVQLTGATFYYDYTNKQISGRVLIVPFGPLPRLVNIPKSRVYGAEIEAVLQPVAGLRISGGVSYNNSKIEENPVNPYDSYGNVADFTGESFPITPRWQGVVDAEYKFPATDQLSMFVGGTLTARTSASTALGNTTTQALGLPPLEVPGYALVDLRAGVESSDGVWRLQAWGRNVSNKFYLIHAARQSDDIIRTVGMPRTYGLTLSYRY